MHYFDQSAINLLDNVFLIAGVWFLSILIPNTKFYGVKPGSKGYQFMKKEKIQNKNLHNYSTIYTPYSIRLTQVGVEGVCFLADCLRRYAKMASSRQLFWLVDLPLDIYVSI